MSTPRAESGKVPLPRPQLWLKRLWTEEGILFLFEVGDKNVVVRQIQISGDPPVAFAASALSEVMEALRDGGVAAVVEYESIYGGLADQPLYDSDIEASEPISRAEFDREWAAARKMLSRAH